MLATSGIMALGSSLLYFRQNSIIYPSGFMNSRTEVPRPAEFHIDQGESIYLPTPDGETLHAYFVRPSNASLRKNVTILAFHGNAGNIGHRLPIAKVLSDQLGCHVFMPEYRGYGLSTGAPDESGLTIDAQTALDYVRSHPEMQKTKIVLYGQSLGGAVTIRLLASNLDKASGNRNDTKDSPKIAGVILENTFTSIRKLIPFIMPAARYISLLCHQRWPSDETIQTIPANGPPILFLSGQKDEIVPPIMMRTLYDVCKIRRKTWKAFRNGDHNSSVSEPGYFVAVMDFLAEEVLQDQREKSNLGETDVEPEQLWT